MSPMLAPPTSTYRPSTDPNRLGYPGSPAPQPGNSSVPMPAILNGTGFTQLQWNQLQSPGGTGGANPWAYPGDPTYHSAYNPDTMSLYDRNKDALNAIQPNTQGIDEYRKEALRTGPSAWASLGHQTQDAQAAGMKQKLSREQASTTAGAESALAMRGGLTGGARERVQKGAQQDYLNMSQDVGRQQGLNNLQIDTQDEQNRISQLGALPGMENQALEPQFEKLKLAGQAQQFDLGNQIAEGQRYNDWTQNIYNQKMGAWGAGQTAQATQNSGK